MCDTDPNNIKWTWQLQINVGPSWGHYVHHFTKYTQLLR